MILILFLVLLLAYVAAFLGAEQRRDDRVLGRWWMAALAVGLCSAGVFLWIVFPAELSKRTTQLAWIGISTRHGEDALDLGGSRQKATVGWPNGSFSPAVKIAAKGEKEAAVTVSGGGGFVRGPQGLLNGVAFSEGKPAQIGAFTTEVDHEPAGLCLTCRATIRIRDSSGQQVAKFEPRVGSEPRVSSLYSNLTVDIARLRKTDGGAAQALESWCADLRLLVSRMGFRVLGPDAPPVTSTVALPAQLTVYWPGQAQPVDVNPLGERLIEATFLPPWRLASPLPDPTSREGDTSLTMEPRAMPGDFAFLLPLGGELGSFNQTVSLRNAKFDRPDKVAHPQEFRKVLSEEEVYAGKYALRFATVHDQPSWPRVMGMLAIALGIFGFGLWLAAPRMRWRDGWVLGGLASSVWVILLIRLMLAFRYALDPAHFDKFAFDGVALAARALVLVPALVLIAARMRRDRVALLRFASEADRARAGKSIAAYLFAALIASGVVTWLAHSLWPNEEARYGRFSFGLSTLFTAAIVTVAILWVMAYLFFLYFYDPERGDVSERFRQGMERWRSRFLRRVTETFALEQSTGFWRHLGATLDDDDEYDRESYWTRVKVLSLVLLSLVAAAVIIGGVGYFTGASEKFLQEVAAPFLLCWMPACVWLAARLRFRPGSRMSRRSMGWLVPWLLASVLLILAPVILFPVLLGDAGGIVATFAFFWPMVALLAAGGKPRRLQFLPMGVLLLAVAGAGVIYLNLNYITRLPGEARVRLLIFKEGMNLQDRLPGLPMLKEDASSAPTVRQVSQGLQHTWENKAIAHEGGWFGEGFGKAPVRRSQVPQHTLQVDSTYSFYIQSDFGLVGGFALLCIYAMPLVWVLISSRQRLDVGHGLAVLITSAFVLEAIFHAGMNLTAFPYTGRDLPLLAVGSFTDLVRWTLLFSIAARALQWRAMGADEGFRTESIISPPALPGAYESEREPFKRFRSAVVLVAALPILLFGITMVRGVEIVNDASLSRSFQWTRLLNAVRQAGDEGKLRVDPKTMTIDVEDKGLEQEGGTLMEQEIARFNALTESEKLEGAGGNAAEFRKRLRRVKTVADYDRLLEWLRTLDNEEQTPERPLLFRLVADPRALDDNGQVPVAGRSFQILPNPAFNTSVSFHELRKDDIPTVSLRGQASGAFAIRGRNFEFRIPNIAAKPADDRTITIEEGPNGTFRKVSDSNPDSSDARLQVRYKPEKRAKPVFTFGEIRVTNAGITFRPAVDSRLLRPGDRPTKMKRNVLEKLAPGDHVEVAFAIGKNKIQPNFSIEKTAQGALIGPAWVMGNWTPAYDPDPILPWTASLANALPDEQTRLKKELPARMGMLTFEKNLQAALQTFVTEKGREHYAQYLNTGRASRDPLPPRVAIAVITLPHGEVAGMGGWPRMNSGHTWDTGPAGDPIPPFTWVDSKAPHSLRIRYQSDRNFDRIAVGSESKPLWASAVLQMHRGLENKLDVRGPDEEENQVFGIKIPGKPWAVHPSGWRGLSEYLAVSDNRYQVRLGFLGLAQSDPDRPSDMEPGGPSPSTEESLDAGERPWGHYPVFEEVDFQPTHPGRLRGLEQSKLAQRLKDMYGIGIETGQIVHRRSFWTGDEANDWDPVGKAPLSQALEYTSPEAPDFEFNRIQNPRPFITVLLGGGTNLWSNVDFAGAFGTCVLGAAVVPHVTRLDPKLIKPTKERAETFDNPPPLMAGLRDVVDANNGTANPFLRSTHALAVLNNMNGVRHYAKTGTLGSEQGAGNVSRIALALVRGDRKSAETGVVISVVVENAPLGTATEWLGEFIVQNEQELRRLLGLR